jgi:hypothetical protein
MRFCAKLDWRDHTERQHLSVFFRLALMAILISPVLAAQDMIQGFVLDATKPYVNLKFDHEALRMNTYTARGLFGGGVFNRDHCSGRRSTL